MKKRMITACLLAGLLAASVALAACGGDGDAETTAAETTGVADSTTSSEQDSSAESVPDSETEDETEPGTEPVSETESETESESVSASETETEPGEGTLCRLEWELCRGVSVPELPGGQTVRAGETVRFSLTVSPYYEGTLTVYAGEQTLEPEPDGGYSFTPEADTTIRVEGLTLKTSSMEGTGDSVSDPFLVTSAVDLLYIAEQVNAGNATYVNGFFRLENDIDCQGEPLEIIGDGSSDAAIFAGYFNGNGHTVSNYRINATGQQYVGLFGVLQANVSGTQGGAINDLHLKDFTVTATAQGNSIFCGALVGYGMGGNLVLCSAESGSIEVYADSNAFAYVGGLMGIQEALDYNALAYYSGISYCSTDIQVNCNSGSIYAAGGIVGYMSCSSQMVTASVNNSFATGIVRGAMRAGGIAGCMAQGTSIVNCYSAGEVSAQAFAQDVSNSEEFCYAYAGGLAGYAEPGCILSESFSAATIRSRASVSEKYAVKDGILAYAGQPEDYDYTYAAPVVYNCRYAEGGTDGDIRLTDGSYLQEQLHWNPFDWVFADGSYPTVNTEQHSEYTFEVKFLFGGEAGLSISDFNVYMPLSFWYADGQLPSQLTGDEGDDRVSYGYFFDEACTMPIPDGFIPTHDMTIWAAVADVTPIVGDYILSVSGDGSPLILTIYADGTYEYPDAGQTLLGSYRYDGEYIIFEKARFGRFIEDVTGIGKYELLDFRATLTDGLLTICGGVYEDSAGTTTIFYPVTAPMKAVSCKQALAGTFTDGTATYIFRVNGTGLCRTGSEVTDLTYTRSGDALTVVMGGKTLEGQVTADGPVLGGKALHELDAYVGSWTVDSGAHKVYSFDGIGNWTYTYYGYRSTGSAVNKATYEFLSGTYTEEADGSLTLHGDFDGTATLTDGRLTVSRDGGYVSCHRDGSWYGTWIYEDFGLTLKLFGIRADGQGDVRVEFVHENGTLEAYDLIYALDELDPSTIVLYYDSEVFGYLTYLPERGVLRAMMYVGTQNSFMDNVGLHRLDEYEGTWIGESTELPALDFNGKGSYEGRVTVGDKTVPYTLDEATLSGSFVLGGKTWRIEYREADGSIVLYDGDIATVYTRKDAFGDLTLTDGDGGSYSFDGRGELTDGGTLLVTAADGTVTTYTYRMATDGSLRLYRDDRPVGVLGINETDCLYRLTLDGESPLDLRIKSRYTGVWAMSGALTQMTIGALDLDGKTTGIVNEVEVTFTLQPDGTLLFVFEGTDFYVIPVGETDVVLSAYKDWYLYEDEIICAPMDELAGTWQNSLGASYRFDGMSGSGLTSGAAQSGMLRGDEIDDPTAYAYTYRDGRYILWTVNETTGETLISRLVFCDPSTSRAFINGDKAFTIEKGDRLYRLEATDEDSGIRYTFDGFGRVTTSAGDEYTYVMHSIDQTAGIVTLTVTVDGEALDAVIDFSGTQMLITFEL